MGGIRSVIAMGGIAMGQVSGELSRNEDGDEADFVVLTSSVELEIYENMYLSSREHAGTHAHTHTHTPESSDLATPSRAMSVVACLCSQVTECRTDSCAQGRPCMPRGLRCRRSRHPWQHICACENLRAMMRTLLSSTRYINKVIELCAIYQ